MATGTFWPFDELEEFSNKINKDTEELIDPIETDNRLFLKETIIEKDQNFSEKQTEWKTTMKLNPNNDDGLFLGDHPWMPEGNEPLPQVTNFIPEDDLESESEYDPDYDPDDDDSWEYETDDDDDDDDENDEDDDDDDDEDDDGDESDGYSSDDDMDIRRLFVKLAVVIVVMLMAIYIQLYPFESREELPYVFTLLSKVGSFIVFITNFYIFIGN